MTRKFFKRVENTVGKGDIARYEQFHLFSLLSKDLSDGHVKTRAFLGKGLCILANRQVISFLQRTAFEKHRGRREKLLMTSS